MDREALNAIITFFTALVGTGVATTFAVQLLKQFAGDFAKKYPRLTNAGVSLVASIVVVYNSSLDLVIHGFWQTFAFAVGVFVLAAITYNNVIKSNDDSSTRL